MADDQKPDKPSRGVHVSYEISLGALLQAGVVLVGLIAWFVTYAAKSEQSGKDLLVLQERLTSQITDLRGTVTGGLTDVKTQIATLPEQRAALDQMSRRMADLEQRYNAFDTRLGGLDRAAIECRADLNTLMRAANVPLPSPRR